jgi:hypothetical protein
MSSFRHRGEFRDLVPVALPLLPGHVVPQIQQPEPSQPELPFQPQDMFDQLRGIEVFEFPVVRGDLFREPAQGGDVLPGATQVQVLLL